jgi:tetratricopeptide (TPR) repeat protein
MSRLYTFIILAIILGTGLQAKTTADSLFQVANASYAEGNFQNAGEHYEAILVRGFESAEVYYNLGNCYFKQEEYPRAILNYERALLLDPGNDDIEFNLAKARIYTIDKIEEIPQFVIRRWINSIIILMHSNAWAIVSIVAFVLMLAMFLLYFLSTNINRKRAGFYLAIIALIISTGSYYLASKSKQLVVNSNGAIVMNATVTIKGSPRDTGTDLFIIHEGTKVSIVNSLDDWYEIKLSDGKQGWLRSNAIEPI